MDENYTTESTLNVILLLVSVAKAVAERDHVLMRSKLNVILCEPAQAEKKDTSEDRTPEKHDEKEEPKTTVKVKGVKKFSSPDPVRFYFENKRRSGGGKILDLSFCEDEDEALITFESSESKSYSNEVN